ncbi:MAG: MFS transporter [Acholeplasmatales bacterium]
MIVIGIAGFLLFFGQGFMQVLHIIMLADTIEYGQLKLGKRNEALIFSINPFVVKLATSIQTLVVALTLALSGMNEKVIKPLTELIDTTNPSTEIIRERISLTMTNEMVFLLRASMLIIPFLFVLGSYLLYIFKYKIDEKKYVEITQQLQEKIVVQE